jgi:phosphomevalonate kinase
VSTATRTAITGITASAPGKVLLAGEYAVLAGAEAVVMAINRRAVARVVAPGTQDARAAAGSPFLQALAQAVAAHAGADSPAGRAAAMLAVDSSALRDVGGIKLGLGSSAAATVAACACALAHGPAGDVKPAPDEVHRLAHLAHGVAQSAQGARGSGADIAASVYGGILGVRLRPERVSRPMAVPIPGSLPDPMHQPLHASMPASGPMIVRPLVPDLERSGVHLVFVWTGAPASTPALVARVHAWRDAQPAAYDRAMTALADAAQALIAALRPSGQATDVVAAIAAGAEAAGGLGRAAGVDIETEAHRAIARLAAGHGGASKPTGAGGGDIALAAFATAAAAAAFRAETVARGMKLLALRVDPDGALAARIP